jgi:hypothetical protein
MVKNLFFNFGEKVDEFDFKVLNERDVRASAGIMFLFGILSIFAVFTLRTLLWVELFSLTFIFEFFIRTIINPKYAPYMLLGSLFVANQQPEWVEAKPKQFAWILGMFLGILMTYFIVFDVLSPIRLITCLLCMLLLFLESAFGICLGCLLYSKLHITLNRCAGGVCEVSVKRKVKGRWLVLLLSIMLFSLIYYQLIEGRYAEVKRVIVIES